MVTGVKIDPLILRQPLDQYWSLFKVRRLHRPEPGAEAAQVVDPDALTSPLNDRNQSSEVEIYGGKGIVLMEEAKELLHGKALAETTAVVPIIPSSEM